MLGGLLTHFETVSAIDVGEDVAFVFGAFERVEDESVFAEHLLGNTIFADVVFIALELIFVLAIFGRADELT